MPFEKSLQQQFEDEVHETQPGLVPGMPAYIKWLEAKVEKLTSTNKQSESLLCPNCGSDRWLDASEPKGTYQCLVCNNVWQA